MSKKRSKYGREALRKLGTNARFQFTTTFERFGKRSGWVGDETTVLFSNVEQNGNMVTDHLWFTCGKTWSNLDLHEGDQVQFMARVAKYEKGYKGNREQVWDYHPIETDYKLERPTKAAKITSSQEGF
ncbi:hypothetical protein [Lacticaseibacillus parakribbianus]|uniref:hypothetical protein n=1 Tax=Lacticaseibacillus parakribbianus TaxID=2970927 RepID=UPI0021CB937C|nr:hypothetical protein [Lacticaseibacillus parakribbianus]